MARNLEKEMDALREELTAIKELMKNAFGQGGEEEADGAKKQGHVQVMNRMHLNPVLSRQMKELCEKTNRKGNSGLISYMGVFASGGRQSNWIRNEVNADSLLSLGESGSAQKVLSCIGNQDRLNMLMAILRHPMNVAEIVEACHFNTTGQAYHHMKALLSADLIMEDSRKGVYVVKPQRVQGIIMLLAGISDIVDQNFTLAQQKDFDGDAESDR